MIRSVYVCVRTDFNHREITRFKHWDETIKNLKNQSFSEKNLPSIEGKLFAKIV